MYVTFGVSNYMLLGKWNLVFLKCLWSDILFDKWKSYTDSFQYSFSAFTVTTHSDCFVFYPCSAE